MVCQFLQYSKVTQCFIYMYIYIYIYSFSHIILHLVSSQVIRYSPALFLSENRIGVNHNDSDKERQWKGLVPLIYYVFFGGWGGCC